MSTRSLTSLSAAVAGGIAACWLVAARCVFADPPPASAGDSQLMDISSGQDWPAYGRTFGEQHFSPLADINSNNVKQLGLVWFDDLPAGNSVTQPIEVQGFLYFASGYSVVHAIDVATGKELWTYDPKVPKASGKKLRLGWGSRGIAWWQGKLYTGTLDGRLIAIDAASGRPLWWVMTVDKDDGRYITGAPRVFRGMVVIGHGGADVASIRGYVTAYDAQTGRQIWRFYLVPGKPADGFENKAMEMAAKTWFGEWWKYGGGGTVWNAMTYDPDTDTLFLGTGNGSPWNRKIRSQGRGDNLFLSCIVALDAQTGAYKWHYQTNPGESWDYNAAMDMELADLTIGGAQRKVLLTAPKNGFVYVLDRSTGGFISAKPFVRETWAKDIDASGRPIETPNSRYETGPFLLAPSAYGGHSWLPMAYSPKSGLLYIPALEIEAVYSDAGVSLQDWRRPPNFVFDDGVAGYVDTRAHPASAALIAWNPVTQAPVWRVPMPAPVSGGVVATGGNLVFQGSIDSRFHAYDGSTGQELWTFDAKAPVMAPPISYSVAGRQYVTVITGAGTSLVLNGWDLRKYGISYRDQKRRVLTFALGGNVTLPAAQPYEFVAAADPDYHPDPAAAKRGLATYSVTCLLCHGVGGYAAGVAPDLRASTSITSQEAFASVVAGGALVAQGMPRFEEMTRQTREDLRQYLRSLAAAARQAAK